MSPAQAGCMRQVLGPGALARPRRIRWRRRWEGGSGWGTHVTPWLIHVNVWQNPLQCCEVISLQLIKINEKKKKGGSCLLRASHSNLWGFPGDSAVKNPPASAGDAGDMSSIPGSGRFPGGSMATHSSISPRKSHGQRSLEECSPWGCRESYTSWWLNNSNNSGLYKIWFQEWDK